MLAGVSTRRFARTGEPVGAEVDELARSTSKSAVSREFVSRTREHLIELMSRPLEDVRLAVLMLDGIELKGRCCMVALGIDTDGVKHPLGLWDGSTENATVATTLLANLVERGLDVDLGVLVVIDGAKALRRAVHDVLGIDTPVQRCVRHKERNVLGHLPERDRPLVRRRLRQAWALDDHAAALERLQALANELERSHPGAAASLREGLEETLTVIRLGVRGRLKRTLQSTDENVKCGRRRGCGFRGGIGRAAWSEDRGSPLRPRLRRGPRVRPKLRVCAGLAGDAARWRGRSAVARLRCGRGRPPSEAQDPGLSPAAQLLPHSRAARVAPHWRRPRPLRAPVAWPASRRPAGDTRVRPAR
jgi:hypothetical protein